MHGGYGPAVPGSRANASGMVSQPPPTVSGLLYGLGLGGFIDGIVLHQILQWHHMVSDLSRYPVSTIAGLEVNTLADGFFHLATWVLVLVASIAAITAWRQGRLAPNWSFHFGLVLTGWGIFNVVEGLIDHQIFGVHHSAGRPWWAAFLGHRFSDLRRSAHRQRLVTAQGRTPRS
jgi:uncharacterized membrane protein